MKSTVFGVQDISKLIDCDRHAFERFDLVYSKIIRSIILKILQDNQDVDDCYHDFLIDVPRLFISYNIIKYDKESDIRSWLWKTVSTFAYKCYNKRNRIHSHEVQLNSEEDGPIKVGKSKFPNPEKSTIRKELFQIVNSVIDSIIIDKDIKAFLLRHGPEEQSFKVITQILKDNSEANTRGRIGRGRGKLKKRGNEMFPGLFKGNYNEKF